MNQYILQTSTEIIKRNKDITSEQYGSIEIPILVKKHQEKALIQ